MKTIKISDHFVQTYKKIILFFRFGWDYINYPYIMDWNPQETIRFDIGSIINVSYQNNHMDWLCENIDQNNYKFYYNNSLIPHYIMFKHQEDMINFKLSCL